MKGKKVFTQSEADQIILLIRKKLLSDASEQKNIRNKIRKLGFYASDFGIGGGYTEQDFKKVIQIAGNKSTPIKNEIKNTTLSDNIDEQKKVNGRSNSDEAYILNLCDEVLGIKGSRQFRFDFLRGDSGHRLPVDAYYVDLGLVIEYKEKQHTESVKFFDRKQTVSGVSRGEQRKKYDQLRRDILPQNGLKLIEFDYSEFAHTRLKRLLRAKRNDINIIKIKLQKTA